MFIIDRIIIIIIIIISLILSPCWFNRDASVWRLCSLSYTTLYIPIDYRNIFFTSSFTSLRSFLYESFNIPPF